MSQKQPDSFFFQMYIESKIFDWEMLQRSLPTTLLCIFCEIIFNSIVFDRSDVDPGRPDDTSREINS